MSPKINHTSAGKFFLKEGYQDHLIDLKKVFQEKILEQWDKHMSKKKKVNSYLAVYAKNTK